MNQSSAFGTAFLFENRYNMLCTLILMITFTCQNHHYKIVIRTPRVPIIVSLSKQRKYLYNSSIARAKEPLPAFSRVRWLLLSSLHELPSNENKTKQKIKHGILSL